MSSRPSTQLIQWVHERETPLSWISYNEQTGRLELVIDNYLLSRYRACPANFMLMACEGWKKKGFNGAPERSWFLDFGILFHKMMELYYKHFREPSFDLANFAIPLAVAKWKEMNMDVHLSHKECQQIGGAPGFAGMMVQYAVQFMPENERLKILASEVAFGRNREVPLYTEADALLRSPQDVWSWADIYLSGRIDIIADDGFRILPLDHKTLGSFRGDPMERFLIDDGPTGYIYALKKVLPTIVPEDLILKRDCNSILMNLISKSVPKEGSRFKRFALQKSDAAIEAYRVRQINTCNKILEDLELYIRDLGVSRNTSMCTNWYYYPCEFYDVHRQQDRSGELNTLANGYIKLPIWNTENVQPTDE